MFVCLCNAVRDKQVSAAVSQGANSVKQVYEMCGCAPQCGKCALDIRQRLNSAAK